MSPVVLDQPALGRTGFHPALRSFADECSAVFVRLLAYVCGLAVLAAIVADFFSSVPVRASVEPPPAPGWATASRPHPAFAISQLDLTNRTDGYEILRHPDGGRKDILRWAQTASEAPTSELELYRPGSEVDAFAAPDADLAFRMGLRDAAEAENAGVIDTKFGPVALLRFGGEATKAPACMAFAKAFETPKLRISGWACQGDSAAQRAALTCSLNRLTLLSAGNDPKVAELFARAELKRASCASASASTADWVTAPQEPRLRGRI
ncbi:MAG: hypothetical protein HY242_13890 [Afipia sp.]|nr:hypothetical protein [Afipia sp.]